MLKAAGYPDSNLATNRAEVSMTAAVTLFFCRLSARMSCLNANVPLKRVSLSTFKSTVAAA